MIYYRNKILILSFLLSVIFTLCQCSGEQGIVAPEKILSKQRTIIISGEKAVEIINQMHGMDVATDNNLIAEYGHDPKDFLYISRYQNSSAAEKAFKLMIDKINAAQGGPFSHLQALPDYDGAVYMVLGLGAVHYIYQSSYDLIWFQTFQTVGRILPPEITRIFPVEADMNTNI